LPEAAAEAEAEADALELVSVRVVDKPLPSRIPIIVCSAYFCTWKHKENDSDTLDYWRQRNNRMHNRRQKLS